VFEWKPERPFDLAITNPPFRHAMEVVQWCLAHAERSVLLLRLNFLGSVKRAPFLREHTPDVYVLPNRPSFTGRGTDSVEYAWFDWDRRRNRPAQVQVLPLTPANERRSG